MLILFDGCEEDDRVDGEEEGAGGEVVPVGSCRVGRARDAKVEMERVWGRVKWERGGSSAAIFKREVYRSRREERAVEGWMRGRRWMVSSLTLALSFWRCV